jgi:hypothetical protein
MSMTDSEQRNEYRINAYTNYLRSMSRKELLEHFNDMSNGDLLKCMKLIYGNDGRDDCNFEE